MRIPLTHLLLVLHTCVNELLSLVQVMACSLLGTKPLPQPMLAYCQLDSWKYIFQWNMNQNFYSRKWNWKCRLPKWRPFCPGGDEVKLWAILGFRMRVITTNTWFRQRLYFIQARKQVNYNTKQDTSIKTMHHTFTHKINLTRSNIKNTQ